MPIDATGVLVGATILDATKDVAVTAGLLMSTALAVKGICGTPIMRARARRFR
jgi:hypothetical protein